MLLPVSSLDTAQIPGDSHTVIRVIRVLIPQSRVILQTRCIRVDLFDAQSHHVELYAKTAA